MSLIPEQSVSQSVKSVKSVIKELTTPGINIHFGASSCEEDDARPEQSPPPKITLKKKRKYTKKTDKTKSKLSAKVKSKIAKAKLNKKAKKTKKQKTNNNDNINIDNNDNNDNNNVDDNVNDNVDVPEQSASATPNHIHIKNSVYATELYTYQRKVWSNKEDKEIRKTTKCYLVPHTDHPISVKNQTDHKLGVVLGAFKGQLLGEMCDIPEEVSTEATKKHGVEKTIPAKLRPDGTTKKPEKVVYDMKNRAYDTLDEALEQIKAFASHKSKRSNGTAWDEYDKKGCGVPCGVVWTSRGSRKGTKGHYRIRWGYRLEASSGLLYQHKPKIVYSGTPDDEPKLVGRSPPMVYQPDYHDKSGGKALSKVKRKTLQSSLCWVWSGAISSQNEIEEFKNGYTNKNKWDGFEYSDGDFCGSSVMFKGNCLYEMSYEECGTNRFRRWKLTCNQDMKEQYESECGYELLDHYDFNRNVKPKTTKKKKKTKKVVVIDEAEQQKLDEINTKMIEELEFDSDDEC